MLARGPADREDGGHPLFPALPKGLPAVLDDHAPKLSELLDRLSPDPTVPYVERHVLGVVLDEQDRRSDARFELLAADFRRLSRTVKAILSVAGAANMLFLAWLAQQLLGGIAGGAPAP